MSRDAFLQKAVGGHGGIAKIGDEERGFFALQGGEGGPSMVERSHAVAGCLQQEGI